MSNTIKLSPREKAERARNMEAGYYAAQAHIKSLTFHVFNLEAERDQLLKLLSDVVLPDPEDEGAKYRDCRTCGADPEDGEACREDCPERVARAYLRDRASGTS